MSAAWHSYSPVYDEVLQEVHARLSTSGYATKLDLAALIAWKHVRNAPWMAQVLDLSPLTIQSRTQAAFENGLTDQERLDALSYIPGFGGGGAFTSVLLTAWRPSRYGVYDENAATGGWPQVVSPKCVCDRSNLVVYFDHLRQMATELGSTWTPRDVDIALFKV
jgi:hypothetical protein